MAVLNVRAFVRERRSWLVAFGIVLMLSNLLFWLDGGLGLRTSSVVYYNGLLLVLAGMFLIWRYRREMAYWRELVAVVQASPGQPLVQWRESLPQHAASPLERAVDQALQTVLKQAGQEAAEREQRYALKTSDLEAWVHEMKTPMTAMKLQLDEGSEDARLRKLAYEWTRLHLLLEQQLHLARLPSIAQDTRMEETTLKALVYPEIRAFATICQARGIGFELEGTDLRLVTDVKWSRFIVRQLLSNAIKYSPDGGTIYVFGEQNGEAHEVAALHGSGTSGTSGTSSKSGTSSTSSTSSTSGISGVGSIDSAAPPIQGLAREAGGGVRLTIIDSGPGIAPHELPRVFEKGYTGEAGRTGSAATGLGLYLARQAATPLGIQVSLSSKLPSELSLDGQGQVGDLQGQRGNPQGRVGVKAELIWAAVHAYQAPLHDQ